MNIKNLVDFIKKEIKKLEVSLKENSWEECDDDECPDSDKRAEDQAQIVAYQKILNFINKKLTTYYD
jgi:hypothetical protein